jgi:predicted amidohydrolase YtcJ
MVWVRRRERIAKRVLAEDPHSVDAEKIKDIEIVRTVVGGKTVYQA